MISRGIYLWTLVAVIGCARSPEVLVITGGHAYDTTEFYKLFESMEGIHWDSISHPAALDLLSSTGASRYNVLVFYDYVPDLPPEDSVIYLNLGRQGMPMIFLHHALCNFQSWEGYRQMVGGTYVMPGYASDSGRLSGYAHDLDLEIRVLDPTHPVTSGISDFSIHDEGYDHILINNGVKAILGTQNPQCSPVVAWENRWLNSTCLYLMSGHDKQAYSNEHFQRLLQNSIQYVYKP